MKFIDKLCFEVYIYYDNILKTAVLCNASTRVSMFADKATSMNLLSASETMELINQRMYSGRTTGRLFEVQHNQFISNVL